MEIKKTRSELVETLKNSEAEALEDIRLAESEIDLLKTKFKMAEDELKAIGEQWRRAKAELSRIRADHDRETAQIKRELIETADPMIDDFIERWNDVLTVEQRKGPLAIPCGKKYDAVADRKTSYVETNAPSMSKRHAAIRQARANAEKLKLDDYEDIEIELAQLEATIPALEAEILPRTVPNAAEVLTGREESCRI